MEFVWRVLSIGFAMVVGVALGYGARDQSADMELAACKRDVAAPCTPKALADAVEAGEFQCMSRLDPSGCVPELHHLMAGTYHRTPPGTTDCERLPDGGTWSW